MTFRHRKWRSGALLGVVALVGGFATAGELSAAAIDPDAPGLAPSDRLARLLDRSKLEQAKVERMAADFVQLKENSMLLAPEERRGRFLYAADPQRREEAASVRWEYASPRAMTVVIADRLMTTWYHELGRADRVSIGRFADQAFKYLGSGGSLESLYQYFEVAARFPGADSPGTPYQLDLTPRYSSMKKKLAAMTIWVDRSRFLPIRFRYVETDGDTTEYRFENVMINPEIPAGTFQLVLPPDVEVRELKADKASG